MPRKRLYKSEEERLEAIRKAQKKYFQSEKGKKAQKKYNQSEKREKTQKKYNQSEKGKAKTKRSSAKFYNSVKGKKYREIYTRSEKYRKIQKKYLQSEKGIEMIKKIHSSDRYKKAVAAYRKSEKGKKAINKRMKKRSKEDPFFRIRHALSSRLGQFLKSKGQRKVSSVVKLIGCTKKELINHLEKQFYSNPKTGETMTWKNHSLKGWHVDHINPLSAFRKSDLSDIEIQKKAMNYKNLQPLWAEENLKKSDK